jgi:hypothetical protein
VVTVSAPHIHATPMIRSIFPARTPLLGRPELVVAAGVGEVVAATVGPQHRAAPPPAGPRPP